MKNPALLRLYYVFGEVYEKELAFMPFLILLIAVAGRFLG